ncbi:MAG: hypothetical protein JW965_09330 [Bacteroidales bacterium]|nr:hypothetical protein [Bacteroidales bacterium]
MKNKIQDNVRVYSMLLKSDKLEKANITIIEEAYCPNGHSLISNDVLFCDFKAIHLKIRNKRFISDLFVSPIVGDKSKVSLDTKLNRDMIYEFLCPVCNTTLPVTSPCSCGGSLMTLYLDKNLKLSNSVTICNRFGCPHSEVKGIDKLKSMQL